MFSTIVVGTNGSESSQRAVLVAAEIAKSHNAALYLVNAYREASDEGASALILADAATSLGGQEVGTRSKRGAPAESMIDVAEEVGADLIVVGSRGMHGARRMLGSVPNRVAHGAPCHVIVAKTTT